MDGALPSFPSFDYETDKANAGPRWEKCLARLENLFTAMNVGDDQDARRRALLLHYAGERVYDIYDAEKGEGPWSFKETSEVLTKYFKPKTNVQIEIFTFRSCTQKPGQLLDDFVTELRTLSRNCGFGNVDHEILCQLTQHCRSNRLRRRALREPGKSLADILELGRTLELADTQASLMEKDSRQEEPVNAVHHRKITPRWPRANAQAEVFNKPLMKAVRAAVVEGKNWKQQLYVFLRQYRATPHPSTGFTPYRLLLGHEPRTKLPELGSRPEDLVHLTARQRDARAKSKMKAYADRNIQARQSNIQVGDRVLVRAETRNKLSPAYIPREYTVTHKRGNMVTAESHDHMVTRNSSRFKPSSAKPTPEEIPDLDEEPFSPAAEAAAKQAPSNPGEPSASPTPEKRVLPCRNRRPPKYLNDFVT